MAQTVTIANGAAVSSALDFGPLTYALRGLSVIVPTGWTAADIGFAVSNDNATWFGLYDALGARVKIAAISTSVARAYAAPPEAWYLGVFAYVRLESLDTADGTAENQTGAKALIVNLVV